MMDIFRPTQIAKRFKFRYNYTLPLTRLVMANLICKYILLVFMQISFPLFRQRYAVEMFRYG